MSFLGENCCFLTSKSVIVRDGIKKLKRGHNS
jgi:hypothetical protein